MASSETLHTRCCIVGGGPAGMMLGLLLARAGVDVIVVEKHKDFLRDFRGDTVHPSTLQVMEELGLLQEFLKRPHQELHELSGVIGGEKVTIADFSHVPGACKFVALMPQWDFLDFLSAAAKRYPAFRLRMETEGVDLIEENGAVVGVRAKAGEDMFDIRTDLVVGADGRHSLIRDKAGFARDDFGVPIDVLWMKLPKKPGDDGSTLGRIAAGAILVTLDRGEYWQCAFVIAKGGAEALRAKGMDVLRDAMVRVAPMLQDRVGELQGWDQIRLLTVTVDRLRQWAKPGLLCIGDAAHAMSPIGGVGINLAIQDAVASANILAETLRNGPAPLALLNQVQKRRTFPTRFIQNLQMAIQDRVMTRVLNLTRDPKPPFLVKLLDWFPVLRRIPARLVGTGPRPEHVRTREVLNNP
jgi:2-polyprenyl-6-methoxyphenol hydroxylase-like FAD-dependent oxidoreductase